MRFAASESAASVNQGRVGRHAPWVDEFSGEPRVHGEAVHGDSVAPMAVSGTANGFLPRFLAFDIRDILLGDDE